MARRQAMLWADPDTRLSTARAMYAIRLGEELPRRDIAALRGMEGARMREMYKLMARQYGIPWDGRRYDRHNPDATDHPNMAVNHAAVAVRAAAEIAVAATATIPQLGFIHEDSSISFALDIADLFRDEFTLPTAFSAFKTFLKDESQPLERVVRRMAGAQLRKRKVIPGMIDRIKELLGVDDRGGDA
jgi:CRISPR-associated protein Cas1